MTHINLNVFTKNSLNINIMDNLQFGDMNHTEQMNK